MSSIYRVYSASSHRVYDDRPSSLAFVKSNTIFIVNDRNAYNDRYSSRMNDLQQAKDDYYDNADMMDADQLMADEPLEDSDLLSERPTRSIVSDRSALNGSLNEGRYLEDRALSRPLRRSFRSLDDNQALEDKTLSRSLRRPMRSLDNTQEADKPLSRPLRRTARLDDSQTAAAAADKPLSRPLSRPTRLDDSQTAAAAADKPLSRPLRKPTRPLGQLEASAPRRQRTNTTQQPAPRQGSNAAAPQQRAGAPAAQQMSGMPSPFMMPYPFPMPAQQRPAVENVQRTRSAPFKLPDLDFDLGLFRIKAGNSGVKLGFGGIVQGLLKGLSSV